MITLSVTSPSHNARLLGVSASVPIGQRGIVTIRGRNDISVDQKMGISWVIKDPDGIVVEEYSRWEMFATAPGDEQDFIGGRFDLDKEGIYTIKAELLMNPDSPVIVDSYEGDLCTVTTAEAEFANLSVTYTKI